MTAPAGYTQIQNSARCRCMNMWQESDGTFWCCNCTPVGPGADANSAARERMREAIAEWWVAPNTWPPNLQRGSIPLAVADSLIAHLHACGIMPTLFVSGPKLCATCGAAESKVAICVNERCPLGRSLRSSSAPR